MLYGATGFTGRLVAEEAVRRGHRPLLAGRSAEKLEPLAARLGLDYRAFSLAKTHHITAYLEDVDLVYHAAGPFIHTSRPMLNACLRMGAHYLDITGEYFVFQHTFAHDELARRRGIALIPGVGFDVVPSDCLAAYVAGQVPGATTLQTGIRALAQTSAGTFRSLLHMLPLGNRVRRDGQLVPYPFGAGGRTIRFPDGDHYAIPVPWGDVEVAYHTTGIPDITAYLTFPRVVAWLARVLAPPGQVLLSVGAIRRGLGALGGPLFRGPSQRRRDETRSYLWARAANAKGDAAEAWMVTPEAYRFTALAAIRCVERTLESNPSGALTPAQAFGTDFALEIPGVQRYDAL